MDRISGGTARERKGEEGVQRAHGGSSAHGVRQQGDVAGPEMGVRGHGGAIGGSQAPRERRRKRKKNENILLHVDPPKAHLSTIGR